MAAALKAVGCFGAAAVGERHGLDERQSKAAPLLVGASVLATAERWLTASASLTRSPPRQRIAVVARNRQPSGSLLAWRITVTISSTVDGSAAERGLAALKCWGVERRCRGGASRLELGNPTDACVPRLSRGGPASASPQRRPCPPRSGTRRRAGQLRPPRDAIAPSSPIALAARAFGDAYPPIRRHWLVRGAGLAYSGRAACTCRGCSRR